MHQDLVKGIEKVWFNKLVRSLLLCASCVITADCRGGEDADDLTDETYGEYQRKGCSSPSASYGRNQKKKAFGANSTRMSESLLLECFDVVHGEGRLVWSREL